MGDTCFKIANNIFFAIDKLIYANQGDNPNKKKCRFLVE